MGTTLCFGLGKGTTLCFALSEGARLCFALSKVRQVCIALCERTRLHLALSKGITLCTVSTPSSSRPPPNYTVIKKSTPCRPAVAV